MRSKLLPLAFVFIAAAFMVTGAAAGAGEDTIEIDEDNKEITHACTGATVVMVSANKNTVTLTGECAKVEVLGNENKVTIAATAAISVTGNKNTVTWESGVGGKKPKISNLGNKNKISKKK